MLYHCSFTNLCRRFSFNQVFMLKIPCNWVYLGDFAFFSVSTESPQHCPPNPTPTQLLSRWHLFNWVLAKLRSFCYLPACQTGKKESWRIEEYLHSEYGRLQIVPSDVIRIVLNLHNFDGPIYSSAEKWDTSNVSWVRGLKHSNLYKLTLGVWSQICEMFAFSKVTF
jgi:hypothetical protein